MSYSEFEHYLGEAITPSMYHFMSGYQGTVAQAVEAYFALSLDTRIYMHKQTLAGLRAKKYRVEAEIHEEEQWAAKFLGTK